MSGRRCGTPVSLALSAVPRPLCSSLPGRELGTARPFCFHLSAVLSPNVARTMEWNPKGREVNSFLVEFLCLWTCSRCLCEPGFNFCILSLTLTSLRSLSRGSAPALRDASPGVPQDREQQARTTLSLSAPPSAAVRTSSFPDLMGMRVSRNPDLQWFPLIWRISSRRLDEVSCSLFSYLF